MAEVTGLSASILNYYNYFVALLPQWGKDFFGLFILVLLVLVYSFFVWKLYRFISTKNILKLNLNQYNKSKDPFLAKLIASLFYLLEYVVILPFLIFFWFGAFTLFLILLTENLATGSIVVVSAAVVAVVRIASYYNQNLSQEVAKVLPFTLLAVALLEPGFFNVTRIFTQFGELTTFFGSIIHYLLFIVFLEIILRFFTFLFGVLGIIDIEELAKGTEDEEKETE